MLIIFFSFVAPSKCHPNPCENGGTCVDKYDYIQNREGMEDRGRTQADTQKDDEYTLNFPSSYSRSGVEAITPVDPELLRENGDSASLILESPVTAVSERERDRDTEKRNNMPDWTDHLALKKKSVIAKPKVTSSYGRIKYGHVPTHKSLRDHTGRYDRRSNMHKSESNTLKLGATTHELGADTHKLESKRSMIFTKVTTQVNYDALSMDGYVCICTEHYRGKKCKGKYMFVLSIIAIV